MYYLCIYCLCVPEADIYVQPEPTRTKSNMSQTSINYKQPAKLIILQGRPHLPPFLFYLKSDKSLFLEMKNNNPEKGAAPPPPTTFLFYLKKDKSIFLDRKS